MLLRSIVLVFLESMPDVIKMSVSEITKERDCNPSEIIKKSGNPIKINSRSKKFNMLNDELSITEMINAGGTRISINLTSEYK